MDDTIKIVVKTDVADAVKGLNQVDKAADNTKKSFTGMVSGMKTAIAGAGVVVALGQIKQALGVAFDAAKTYAEFKQATDAMAKQFGKNADEVIAQLNKVSGGTISSKDLVISANRAMALNVTQDVGTMAKLLEYARIRAQALGTDTTSAFNDIVTGIGRGSPMILDNLGIITKGWDEEAKASGKAFDSQFVLNKVLADASKELQRTGPPIETVAEKMQKFEIAMNSGHKTLGKVVFTLLTKGGIIDGMSQMTDSLNKVGKSDTVLTGIMIAFLTIKTILISNQKVWVSLVTAIVDGAKIIVDALSAPINAIRSLLSGEGLKKGWDASLQKVSSSSAKFIDDQKKLWETQKNDIFKIMDLITGKAKLEDEKQKLIHREMEKKKTQDTQEMIEKRKKFADEYLTGIISGYAKEIHEEQLKYEEGLKLFAGQKDKLMMIESVHQNNVKMIQKKALDEYIADEQSKIDAENARYNSALEAAQGNADAIEKVEAVHAGNMAKLYAEQATNFISFMTGLQGQVVGIFNLAAENTNAQLANELTQRINKRTEDYNDEVKRLDDKKNMGLIKDAEYNEAKTKLDKGYESGVENIKKEHKKKEYEAEIKAFRLKKASDILDASNKGITLGIAMATAVAAIPVVGPALAAAAIGTAAGITATQIALIASKQEPVMPEYARGGRPMVGRASIVGEVGPEIFVPDRAGTIIPNNRISNITQNQGQSFQINNLSLNGIQDVKGLALALQEMANGMGKTLFV
jgi:hypothetical protein